VWWKTVVKWLRNKVDVDVDLDVEGGAIAVELTLKLGGVTMFTERFEWPIPEPNKAKKLRGANARRKRVVPEAA
jgi:hypothetical protein